MRTATVQLDEGRTATMVWRPGVDRSTGVPTGALVQHGSSCRTVVPWAGPRPVVLLESLEPLTLTGGFECACGERGVVDQGTWVPL